MCGDDAADEADGQHEHTDDGGPEEPCPVSKVLVDEEEGEQGEDDGAHDGDGGARVVYVGIEEAICWTGG